MRQHKVAVTKETTSNGLPDWLRQVSILVAAGLVVWAIQCSDQEAQRRGDTLGEAVGGISTKVDEISTDVTGLKTRQDTLGEAVGNISAKVDEISTDVTGLKTRQDTLGEAVGSISAKVDEISTDVTELKTRQDTLGEAVGSISTKVDAISTDVTGLKTRQEAREDLPETVEALGKSVAALDATVGDLGESVKAMDALQESHEGSHREEYRDLRDLLDEAENWIGSRIDRLEEIVSARGR